MPFPKRSSEFRFQNLSFSKTARKKNCRSHVNERPIQHNFHRFQNVPASCERSLNLLEFALNVTVFYAGNHPYLVFLSYWKLLESS